MNKKKNLISVRVLRLITATVLILVILVGAVTSLGCGTICSLELFGIAFTCPLGFLQITLASRTFVPEAWLSVGLVVLATILLGRFFCAWLCPTPLVKAFFTSNSKPKPGAPKPISKNPSGHPSRTAEVIKEVKANGFSEIMASPYSSYAVLTGSLASAFFFGFPVFCLICPVGLFFGSLFAIRRLFFAQMVTLELILLPAVLVLEIFVLRKWCTKLCPLGALMSIVGSVNKRFFRPRVNRQTCFQAQGINCQVCAKVCPEGINLEEEKPSMRACTNCLECWEKCPTKAVKWLPFSWRKTAKSSGD
ncbi:MAG: 4Fe-4S binding protein [Anaerolineales bacterium]|nr:4Fe-4S binding protein [Anaerolineales bacterium]